MPGLCQPPRARVQGIPASSLMRLLADENFPLPTIETLRNAGHDVTWVRTDHPGAKDAALLELVESDRRVLVTIRTSGKRDATPSAPRTERSYSVSGPSG